VRPSELDTAPDAKKVFNPPVAYSGGSRVATPILSVGKDLTRVVASSRTAPFRRKTCFRELGVTIDHLTRYTWTLRVQLCWKVHHVNQCYNSLTEQKRRCLPVSLGESEGFNAGLLRWCSLLLETKALELPFSSSSSSSFSFVSSLQTTFVDFVRTGRIAAKLMRGSLSFCVVGVGLNLRY
jgi:hypothetical protein